MPKGYDLGGRKVFKVAMSVGRSSVHVVEEGQFWKGDKGWEHRALCGKSIVGVSVELQRVTCKDCRKAVERSKE